MTASSDAPLVALDFGTTNSALAVLAQGRPRLASFLSGQGHQPTYPSVLYFEPDLVDERGMPVPVTGPQGIEIYLEDDGEGRLVQALKSYLVSRSFNSTAIYRRRYTLEALVAAIVRDLRAEAEAHLGPLGERLVCGRPVHFTRALSEEDDAYAIGRLREALGRAGFTDVSFVFEPVAAAFHYERSLERDELVLIADFGGGTSDFTLMRVGPSWFGRPADERAESVLGTHGVPVAGNAFDYAAVRELVAPHLGLGSHYRTPFRRVLEIPRSLYRDLEWHRLSLLDSDDMVETLEKLERDALAPDRVAAFTHIVRYNLGYHLYRAVEAMKVDLSRCPQTTFRFVDDPVEIVFEVDRDRFEACLEHPLAEIEGCVDALLEDAGVEPGEVDRVFTTGGSSFVPAVRRIFERRFGAERVARGDELTSVVSGLAWSAASS